ncbi:hypothetical protein Tco_0871400 [Tanacetum coccineum]
MRITRGNDPLNLAVYEKFRLKTLGFSEWLEVHALASKTKSIPPLPELSTFRISVDDKKRKRTSEIVKEVFVKENTVVDRMYKNLVPPLGVKEEEFHLAATPQLIRLRNGILRGTPEAEEFFKKLELTVKAKNDTSAGIEGLAECKASVSNLRRIQVKDIVKEVEDHLKTYSLAGMDISWYVEGIRQRWQYSDYPITL